VIKQSFHRIQASFCCFGNRWTWLWDRFEQWGNRMPSGCRLEPSAGPISVEVTASDARDTELGIFKPQVPTRPFDDVGLLKSERTCNTVEIGQSLIDASEKAEADERELEERLARLVLSDMLKFLETLRKVHDLVGRLR